MQFVEEPKAVETTEPCTLADIKIGETFRDAAIPSRVFTRATVTPLPVLAKGFLANFAEGTVIVAFDRPDWSVLRTLPATNTGRPSDLNISDVVRSEGNEYMICRVLSTGAYGERIGHRENKGNYGEKYFPQQHPVERVGKLVVP